MPGRLINFLREMHLGYPPEAHEQRTVNQHNFEVHCTLDSLSPVSNLVKRGQLVVRRCCAQLPVLEEFPWYIMLSPVSNLSKLRSISRVFF